MRKMLLLLLALTLVLLCSAASASSFKESSEITVTPAPVIIDLTPAEQPAVQYVPAAPVAAAPVETAKPTPNGVIPACLRFTQTWEKKQLNQSFNLYRFTVKTANAAVTEEINGLINEVETIARNHMPSGRFDGDARVIAGATIRRTGDRWMSFEVSGEVSYSRKQMYSAFTTRVYDMMTGRRIYLTDVFPQNSSVWSSISGAVRTQITNYFTGEIPNGYALEQACSIPMLQQADFMMCPGKLLLLFNAADFYPGHAQTLVVTLYYPWVRDYMTVEAQQQTDNSNYKLIALTFDDGLAIDSMAVVNNLRRFGADATFFVVGYTIKGLQYVAAYEHDTLNTIASHNYEHETQGSKVNTNTVADWKQKFNSALDTAIGIRPTMMRAPGGGEVTFCKAGIDLPVIHWSLSSNDPGTTDASRVASTVIGQASHGDVVLMHDRETLCKQYTTTICKALEEKNFLCVSVDELFSMMGVALQPNHAYTGVQQIYPVQ